MAKSTFTSLIKKLKSLVRRSGKKHSKRSVSKSHRRKSRRGRKSRRKNRKGSKFFGKSKVAPSKSVHHKRHRGSTKPKKQRKRRHRKSKSKSKSKSRKSKFGSFGSGRPENAYQMMGPF